MDLTTITLFVALVASAIGIDTAMHPTTIVLSASVAGKVNNLVADADTLDSMLNYEVMQICATPSVLKVPEVHPAGKQSVAMAIAEAMRLQSLAIALQSRLGYQPEELKLTLLAEGDVIKLMVSGAGLGGRIHTPPFQELLVLQPRESLAALVHRAALVGMQRIDPYITSLYLLQSPASGGDFGQAEAVINETLAQLPPTPVNFDRSLFENLLGIMALFRGRLDEADNWFHRAVASDPADAAADLNAEFVDMQTGRYRDAALHAEELISTKAPTDATLLATAYMTWGAALLALGDREQAEQKLAQAMRINPENSAAYELASDVERARGDNAAADRLHTRALATSDSFENYAEVAALYERSAWKPGQPLTPNPFGKLGLIRFN